MWRLSGIFRTVSLQAVPMTHIRDFFALCELDGYEVERWMAVDEKGLKAPWKRAVRMANLFGEQGLFVLRRAR